MPWRTKDQPDQAELAYRELSHLSDETLMVRLAAGEHDSLAVLFDRYQRVVLRVAMQILRDPTEAEDLLQSVFLEVMQAADKFDPKRGSARVWILQYAYHRGFNRRRYLSTRGAYDPVDGLTVLTDLAETAIDCGASSTESAMIVDQALEQLSGTQRQTLELAFYDGLTMHEIAAKTGSSLDSTRHNYYRGLEKLRTILGKTGKEQSSATQPGKERAYARP